MPNLDLYRFYESISTKEMINAYWCTISQDIVRYSCPALRRYKHLLLLENIIMKIANKKIFHLKIKVLHMVMWVYSTKNIREKQKKNSEKFRNLIFSFPTGNCISLDFDNIVFS